MTVRGIAILVARKLIAIDDALYAGTITPVDRKQELTNIYHAIRLYYGHAVGLAEPVGLTEQIWSIACKMHLRYMIYKEDLPQHGIDRELKNLSKETETMDINSCGLWDAVKTEEDKRKGGGKP